MSDADPANDESMRAQRPSPPRQAPLRRPPLGMPSSVGSAVNGAAEAGAQGFVERGVDTAYTVIDAYLRRGQQAAQRQQPFEAQGAARPFVAPDPLSAWPKGVSAALGQTASSIAGPWLQLARAWVDGLAALAPLAGRMGAAVDPAGTAASRAAAGPRAKVTIEFVSRRLAEVEVSLEPGADLVNLHAAWSRDGQPATAPGELVFHSAPGHVHVRVAVSDAASTGRHHAAVVDGGGQVWGSAAIKIASPGQPVA